MARKINQKIQEIKKELILQEATKVFEKVGYEKMKIASLAKIAGVSQSTIYGMFENKDGLYIEYIRFQIKNFLKELDSLITPSSSNYEKIYAFINLKFEYYMQKEKALDQNIKNNPLFFNSFYHDYTNPFEEIYQYLANTFKQINPSLDESETIELAYSLNSYSDGYIVLWMEKQNIDLMSLVDEICSTCINIVNSKKQYR